MIERIIEFFAKRHLLTNMVVAVILLGGVFAWDTAKKEELPDVTFDFVRVSVGYPGAPAGDVEHFVARPMEEVLRGLDGVYRVTSNSSVGQANISVEIEQGYPNIDEVITEIRNAVLDVRLPDDIVDDPRVRVFKTAKKAILDIALYHTGAPILDTESRRELQRYAYGLESRLLALPEVNSINKRGYLRKEIQIRVHPDKLARFEVPFNTLIREIRANNVRQPAGTIESHDEPKVTLLSELKSAKELERLIVQGGFDGQVVRLGDAADIIEGFEKNKSVQMVNGHEAVMFSVVKNTSYGILEALVAVNKTVESFRRDNLRDTPVTLALLDDESIDVRNRLSLISINGAIGFVFIVLTLFIFLNKRAGIWVAMGIPFTLCFTMIASNLLGYTVNGTTLAAVIIVMGIVVDDAIVVAENISRRLQSGDPMEKAVVQGTSEVFLPIFASIVTTCVAFVPLFFFSGHFGRFVSFIPPIIFLMLGASLFESLFILPGHMTLGLSHRKKERQAEVSGHWFDRIEAKYGRMLERLLPHRMLVLGGLTCLLVFAGFIAVTKMKFVLFPRVETRDLVLSGMTPKGSTRYETAMMTRQIDALLKPYLGKEVVATRTSIARSRRGGAVQENRFRMGIEIVPKKERDKSADELIKEIEEGLKGLKGFQRLKFSKSRWGHSSGSPIELFVQQNDDVIRHKIVAELLEKIEAHPALMNAEEDEGIMVPEYQISLKRDKLKRLGISPSDVASTFRAALEGVVLYEFSDGDEEVRVRLTTTDKAKEDIDRVLSIRVENRRNYLVPLRDIVTVKKVRSPSSIARRDMKRTMVIDADMAKDTKMTPLEAAEDLEKNVFPDILSRYPTTTLAFGGEVKDTRDSKNDFRNAVLLAILLIYGILVVLFNSAWKPLLIMVSIPFGMVGIIFAFYIHGKLLFGFYAAVGALGLAGVVINDSIIMLVMLEEKFDHKAPRSRADAQVAAIAKTRLRAVLLTTLTTVVGVLPTAYGFAGYDSMLAEMMLALSWGMAFGTVITLIMVPCLYSLAKAVIPSSEAEAG